MAKPRTRVPDPVWRDRGPRAVIPRGDAALVNEFARLQHLRLRLENELETWLAKSADTQRRLGLVRQRLGDLLHALEESGTAPAGPAPAPGPIGFAARKRPRT